MGAVHSMGTTPVQLTVVMPSMGNKVLKSQFTTKVPKVGASVEQYFRENFTLLLNQRACGELLNTAVTLRGSSEEIEIENLNDEAAMYVQMGLIKVIFYVAQPEVNRTDREERSAFNALVRERSLDLPMWAHGGRPALTQIFGTLRETLASERLGFHGSADLKMGCEWMLALSNLLYRLSPFHAKLKARNCPMPESFAFSSGANDYKKKGKSEPLLTQELVREELMKLESLSLYPHLDLETWQKWRDRLFHLHEHLSSVLKQLETQASVASARSRQPSLFQGSDRTTSSGIELRDACTSVHVKYTELDKALGAMQPYHPLSLSFYEPTNGGDRYAWLKGLSLSFPTALLKVHVGGNFGVLVWALKRDSEYIDTDCQDIQEALKLVLPVVPQVHCKAQKRAFQSKIRDVCNMPAGIARYIYKELTGDESEEITIAAKERQAVLEERLKLVETFALGCGDAKLLPDLRLLANANRKGETCFNEFWECVQEELDSMTLAADERRHSGVVAYLSEVISQNRLYNRAQWRLDEKVTRGQITVNEAKTPSFRWFKFQFWPGNERVRAALQYTGRFELKMQLQVRNLRKFHAHAYYCAKQKKLVESWIHKYREYSTAGQPDDKANGTVGEPGTATAFLSRQRRALDSASGTGHMQAMDHDAGSSKMRLIPSVFLKQDIPEDIDGSWLRGQVYVTLKNNIFEASEANKTLLEIKECLTDCKPNVWLHADGGGEHHVGHPTVIAAAIAFFRQMHHRVDRLIKTRGCPYHSYLHEVERVMSILNLALYGVAMERPRICHDSYPGMEERFTSSKTTADLRAAGARYPQLKDGLDAALTPLCDMLYERFEQLDLKGTPIKRGKKASCAEADEFFDTIKDLLDPSESTLARGDFKRKHLSSPLMKEFLDTHCIRDPYKIEVYKGCWHAQLCALKAANMGRLPEHEVERLYSTFCCKFGCPPPKTPASVFASMYEVPRPKKSSGVSKYETFEDTYGTPTPVDLPPLKPGEAREIAPPGVLDKEKVQGVILCTCCKRLRCVYAKMKLSAVTNGAPSGCTLKDVLNEMIEANSSTFSCGSDLNLSGFEGSLTGLCRPYVRVKLDCSQHVELQLYSSCILPKTISNKICGYCGEEGSYREVESETSVLLPICDPCLVQHKKSRPSGRKAPRFDRSGMRKHAAQAAVRREAQVNNGRDAMDPPVPPQKRQRPNNSTQDENACPPVNHGQEQDALDGTHANNICGEDSSEDSSESDHGGGSDNEGPSYFVKKIHSVRFRYRRLEFNIEWEDFPEPENFTWEPLKNLPNDMDKIMAFKESWLASGKDWPQGGRV